MPEMPEVQAQAERMTEALAQRTLIGFELLNFAALKTFSPPPEDMVGRRLDQVGRRGKYLVLEFEGGSSHIVHLMQGGRLRLDPKPARKPRNSMARWRFEDQAWLLTEAGTERKAGVWAVNGDPFRQPPLDRLGPEADQLTVDTLTPILSQNSGRIHGLLRDQKLIAGIGRMLANEILYEAAISPFATPAKLDQSDIRRLVDAIDTVTTRSLHHERTLDDIGLSKDRPSKVHNRDAQPCLDCDDTIRAVEYRRYSIFYCPQRQTGGKRLADNTTSRFLK